MYSVGLDDVDAQTIKLGLLVIPRWWRYVSNESSSAPEDVKQEHDEIGVGVLFQDEPWQIASEVEHLSTLDWQITTLHFGIRYQFQVSSVQFPLRVGFYRGISDAGSYDNLLVGSHLTFGAGLSWETGSLDLAYIFNDQYNNVTGLNLDELSQPHGLFISVQFSPSSVTSHKQRRPTTIDRLHSSGESRVQESDTTYKRGLPPNLFAELSFQDENGDGVLEAMESAVIRVKLKNQGKGKAQGLIVSVKDDSVSDSELSIGQKTISKIGPYDSVTVDLPVRAGTDVRTAQHRFRIEIGEYFGYDMDPAYLVLNTKAYERPRFVLSGLEIIDHGENTAAIIEDGLLQVGEQVKVKVSVQNVGGSTAKNSTFQVTSRDPNIYTEQNDGVLGDIGMGDVRDITFILSPNKRVKTTGDLPLFLSLKEEIGHGNLIDFQLPIQLDKKPPVQSVVTIKPNFDSLKAKLKSEIARFEFSSEKFKVNKNTLINIKYVSASRTVRKNSIGVVLGIENYRDLPPAPYSRHDAEIMKEYFSKRLGIEKVVTYLDIEASGFIFDNIFNAETGELQREILKGETELFIYYSGHGIPSKDGNEIYLFPVDGKISQLETQGYSLTKLFDNLSRLGAKSVTVILDACFSGASRPSVKMRPENLIASKGARIKIQKPWLLSQNFTVINSSAADETSLGFDDTETGLLTYYLAAGLQGSADSNHDHKITLGELKNYVIGNVAETSKKIRGLQTPEFFGEDQLILLEY